MHKQRRHQRGYLRCAKRKKGPAKWEFLWREVGPTGELIRRTTVIGSIEQYPTEELASAAINGLRVSVNDACNRQFHKSVRVGDIADHYTKTELGEGSEWYSEATKMIARDFLRIWIKPHWGMVDIRDVRTVAVENWLRQLRRKDGKTLSNSSKAKIRNLMSVLFNHAIRYEWLAQGKNPITHVRQSAARQKDPEILSPDEIRNLISKLDSPFQLMVLVAATTGVRRSELFGLQWKDIDFEKLTIQIRRSVYAQTIGKCKTQHSQKPLPVAPNVINALKRWQENTQYNLLDDWLFASPRKKGRLPFSPNFVLAKIIRPAAVRAGIEKRISWHTFRHTFSTLLIANGEDIKVVQELMRHGTARITVEIYSQAITNIKRRAQQRIVRMITRTTGPSIGP
jgi:integrase